MSILPHLSTSFSLYLSHLRCPRRLVKIQVKIILDFFPKFLAHPTRFLICITLWSLICILSQSVYNFIPYQKWIGKNFGDVCDPFPSWLRQMGLDKIREMWGFHKILGLVASDFLVFSTGCLLLFR